MGKPIRLIELTDGGQPPEAIAEEILAFMEPARETLELALYDVRLPGDIGDRIADAIRAAHKSGVQVRLVFNEPDSFGKPIPVPPPPATRPEVLQELNVPMRAIPGVPDLMHHKYVVRDGRAVWTGSMNWTLDSWTRQENIVAIVHDVGVARAYLQDFEQLWRKGDVDNSGNFDPPRGDIRAWFTPGRGRELSHRIAEAIGCATKRVRIGSPVITSAPIVGTLAEVVSEQRVDVAGVIDGTQMRQVFHQWRTNGVSAWKLPLIDRVLTLAPFAGKPSTPYAPGSLHDYMHAKVSVVDDVVFAGSFNLSRSGEQNAENVLEIRDPVLADRMAAFIDQIRALYPPAPNP